MIDHHHHQSLNREGRWGTTDDFATSFLHFPLFSTAFWDLPNSRPVHFLMLSSHLFLCPPCLLPSFTVPCKMVLARPDDRQWGNADIESKDPSVENPSSKVLPLKLGLGQNIVRHASLSAREFTLSKLYLPSPFTFTFFSKLLPSFPCVSCG